MQRTQLAQVRRNKEVRAKISYFSLEGLLPPGHTLALNLPTRTLSLLCDGPELISVQQFSDNELSVIVPILESFPHYCPYEVLLAHISSNIVTEASIKRCRQRLYEAQNREGQQELRPIRRALSSLRNKLHCFDLEISNIREKGCNLTSLTSTPVSRSSD